MPRDAGVEVGVGAAGWLVNDRPAPACNVAEWQQLPPTRCWALHVSHPRRCLLPCRRAASAARLSPRQHQQPLPTHSLLQWLGPPVLLAYARCFCSRSSR